MLRQQVKEQRQYECKLLIMTLCMAMTFALIPSTVSAHASGQNIATEICTVIDNTITISK